MRALLLLALLPVLGSCWTGATADETPLAHREPVAAPRTAKLRVRLERTPCLGQCPAYIVEIDGRQQIARWSGLSDVAVVGERSVKVRPEDLDALARSIDAARFFERDEHGALPIMPVCTNDGTTTTCTIGASISICSDTTHAIITIIRGAKTHSIDYDHCRDDAELLALTHLIDRMAHSKKWISRE